MSVQAPVPAKAAPKPGGPPGTVWTLAALMALLAVGAIQGGWAMVTDPMSPLGMPVSYLENAPIGDYFLPGVFFLCIAAASLLVAIGLVSHWRWRWAGGIEAVVGHRWPWIGAVAVGGVLLAFEIIELFLVPFHPVMHPLLLAGSSAILLLPFTPSASRFLDARAGVGK